MAIIEIQKTTNLDVTVTADPLHGYIFTNESDGHKFVITGTRSGSPVTLAGVVTARFKRNNKTTVFIAGDKAKIENGKAVVTLLKDCYNVPGRFDFYVYVTSGGATTCVYYGTGTVNQTEEGTLIDSGEAVPSLEELTEVVQNAQAATSEAENVNVTQTKSGNTITLTTTDRNGTTVSNVMIDPSGIIASDFDATLAYSAGTYVIYTDGNLYRLTSDHEANVAWGDTGKAQVTIGAEVTDLKSALSQITEEYGNLYDVGNVQIGKNWIGGNAVNRAVIYIPVHALTDYTLIIPSNAHINSVDVIEKTTTSGSTSLRNTPITSGNSAVITTLENTAYFCIQFVGNTTLAQSDFENYNVGVFLGRRHLSAIDDVARTGVGDLADQTNEKISDVNERIDETNGIVCNNSYSDTKSGQLLDISGCNGFAVISTSDNTADVYICSENLLPENIKGTSSPVEVLLPPETFTVVMDEGIEQGNRWYFRLKTLDGDIVTEQQDGFLPGAVFSTTNYWYSGWQNSNKVSFTMPGYYILQIGRASATGNIRSWLNAGPIAKEFSQYKNTLVLSYPHGVVNANGYSVVYANKECNISCKYMIRTVPQQRAAQAKTLRPQLIANCTAESLNTNEKMDAYLQALYECGFDGIALVVKFKTDDDGATIQEPALMSVIRYAYKRAQEIGLKIKAIKTHYEILLSKWESMNFDVWWPVYLDACRSLYDMKAEYFTILNEAYRFVGAGQHVASINSYLGELKQHGYKTGFTGFAVNADLYSNLDSENFHWYPSLTTKGTQATVDDCILGFHASRDLDVLHNVQRRYKNIEYNVTESGCMRVWEALEYPPRNSWGAKDHFDLENGLPQAMFYDALLQIANECKLNSVWTYYDDSAVFQHESRKVFMKWTGGRVNE